MIIKSKKDIFNDIDEVKKYIKENIKYGWYGLDKEIHINSLKGFKELYRTMEPNEVLKHKVGLCSDQVNLFKYYLDEFKIENKILVLVAKEKVNDTLKDRVHFMIIYKENNNWIQFENSSRFFNGEYIYKDINDCKKTLKEKYKTFFQDIIIFETKNIPIGIGNAELEKNIIKELMQLKTI